MSKISIFPPHALARGSHNSEKEPIELIDFLHDIKYGKWKDQVMQYRSEEDKEKKKNLKNMLPAVTIAGVFQTRNQNSLIKHSGHLCVDIDHFEDKQKIINDPYTYALFYSCGGHGLAVIVKINGEKHKESYHYLSTYYYEKYGINVDTAPSNIASLRYVSYDPGLVINEKSKVSPCPEFKEKKTKKLPVVMGKDDFTKLVAEIQSKQINIAESYEDYRNIGFAIGAEYGESGREYFHTIVSVSNKYQQNQADRQYTACSKGKRGITIGTFYWMCQQAGIKLENKYKKEIQIASVAKSGERDKEYVKKQLIEINNTPVEVAEAIVENVYNNDDITPEAVAVGPREVTQALMEFLRQNYVIKKNLITNKLEIDGKEMTQEVFNTILIKAKSFFDSREITRELLESLLFSEYTESYNPITAYIEKNKHRESTGNISRLYYSIESDTPMKDIFIRKWIISIIAAYEGHPVRSVLALTGAQNSGKSEFFRRLLPDELKKYYAESKLDNGKDDELLMCQKLIVMDDEMGGKSKQDEKRFKELTSKHTFSIRAPYARFNEDYRRLAILCGTSNDPDVISDPTGNTRILPIEVIEIYHDNYNNIDKDELFMEAYRCYHAGEEWQLNKQEIEQLKKMSEEFESIPYERELIEQFFRIPEKTETYDLMTATEIKDVIERRSEQKIQNMKRFGIELKKLFGKKTFVKGSGKYKVITLHY